MKEIIEHINKIDAIAYENEQKMKAMLQKERERLENEIKEYQEHVLVDADEKAKVIYNQILDKANNEYLKKDAMIKKSTYKLKSRYQAVENDIVKEIVERLVEGE